MIHLVNKKSKIRKCIKRSSPLSYNIDIPWKNKYINKTLQAINHVSKLWYTKIHWIYDVLISSRSCVDPTDLLWWLKPSSN